MLSNAYFLAKFRFDTAENEPAKKIAKILLVTVLPILLTASEGRTGVGAAVGSGVGASAVTFSSSMKIVGAAVVVTLLAAAQKSANAIARAIVRCRLEPLKIKLLRLLRRTKQTYNSSLRKTINV